MQDQPTSVSFEVACEARPKGSKRGYVRGGRVVMVESSASLPIYMAHLAHECRVALRDAPWDTGGHYAVALTFTMRRPASHYTADGTVRPRHKDAKPGRPDIDKMTRAVLDALTGIAWADDASVVWLLASKRYGDTHSTHVTIWRNLCHMPSTAPTS